MTDKRRRLNDIEIAALRIAAFPPLRASSETGTAYVPWRYIKQLREQLEAAGVDWRKIAGLQAEEREAARNKVRDYYKAQEAKHD